MAKGAPLMWFAVGTDHRGRFSLEWRSKRFQIYYPVYRLGGSLPRSYRAYYWPMMRFGSLQLVSIALESMADSKSVGIGVGTQTVLAVVRFQHHISSPSWWKSRLWAYTLSRCQAHERRHSG